MTRTVLVAGASGFVGSAVVERFAARGWRVIGISRRRPVRPIDGVEYRTIDLLDAGSCLATLRDVGAVTHLVYAAVNETPGDLVASWTDPTHAARNGRMFENLLDAVMPVAPDLQHVALVHGTKAYATHLSARPFVPLRESLPRPANDDFYFRQEDLLWARRKNSRWAWTVLRAPMIAGGSYGSNLNALLAIGVFASLLKAEGKALSFPGTPDNLGVMEMVDVELLARAVEWAAQATEARDQIFNIANGDTYVWPDLWPIIAAEFGMPVGTPEPRSVRAAIFDRAAAWGALVRKHRLVVPEDPQQFLGESGALADFALGNCSQTVLTSTIKIRQAGFHDCVDTAVSVTSWLRRWRDQRLLPPM
jgi:nucleoside-diphosphate-sugar epimerase